MTSFSELKSGYVMPTLIASAVTPGARVSFATTVDAEPVVVLIAPDDEAPLLDLQPPTASSSAPAVATAAQRARRRRRREVEDTTQCSFISRASPCSCRDDFAAAVGRGRSLAL